MSSETREVTTPIQANLTPMFGVGRTRTISVVRRGEKTYLRAYRFDAIRPSPFQLKARIAFGDAAREAIGEKMKELPPAAIKVKERLSGMYYGHGFHPRKWESLF